MKLTKYQIDEITRKVRDQKDKERKAEMKKEIDAIDKTPMRQRALTVASEIAEVRNRNKDLHLFREGRYGKDETSAREIEKSIYDAAVEKIEEKYDDINEYQIRNDVVLMSIDCVNFAELKRALNIK